METGLQGHAGDNTVGGGATEPETAPQPQTPAYVSRSGLNQYARIILTPTLTLQRTLGQRFFTPQYEARKSARRQPRKSLCDEFGPPVKFQAVLATPVRQALTKMELDSEEASEEEGEVQDRQIRSSEGIEDEDEEETDQMATEPLSYKEEFQRAELERQQAAVSALSQRSFPLQRVLIIYL